MFIQEVIHIDENDDPEIRELLREILKWIRFQGWQDVKQVLIETLGSERERLMYQMSDGRSTNEISRAVGVSGMTVYNYWQRWSKIGIAEPFEGYKGRYKRSFSLDDFGIDFPPIPSQKEPSSKNEKNDMQGGDSQ